MSRAEEAIIIALKMGLAGVLGTLLMLFAPAAQADPPGPGVPCQADACQPPRPTWNPDHQRGVLGCIRGACIPKPNGYS
ncbi:MULTISPECIES: hypothetical protein [Mycobacterium]|uniref:Uncharacterized protein n=1 Tax=Mycobacterium kiyosense TaxID=2871094 RepID=A0A9P3UUX7_9MYCO|nr:MULTISPECIES: hypothetical protein [Mycobacterium]BDB42740.1 hypothetical protein IWGMT90018_31860 [Mycobacterium kiyosense]BDE14010.1 hypothetical protein MKCMC460_28700 [Mycobacterium sp. 20KCMC460]GLB81234.1 hypothetical protein SRL2020028_04900 [Mycobacterium kiyosense]GLB88265.1 hypothetical protein SRL2020130_10820 [Mycobacterium kiyosense]GLB94570.1 hypothetical protein SRL2020226_13460 [Mycobacterium kiyosense]